MIFPPVLPTLAYVWSNELRMVGCVHPAAGRQRCCCQACDRQLWGFYPSGVKFRVVCRGNFEVGLESDTQVGIDNISFRIKTTFLVFFLGFKLFNFFFFFFFFLEYCIVVIFKCAVLFY